MTSFKEDILQDILDKVASNEGFIQPKFSIETATKPGENFVGRIFRVVIKETDGSKLLSLIFKASSPNEERRAIMTSERLFRNETNMYEIILPQLNNFLRKYGICDLPIFPGTARCYATVSNDLNDKTIDVIVLEDKKVQGFGLVDIKTGLDAIQCRLVIDKIAVLHAASVAMDILEPEESKEVKEVLERNRCKSATLKAVLDLKKGYRTGLGYLGEPYKKGNAVYDKLYELYDNFDEDYFKCYDTPEDFSCLTHGDCWSNNMLFRTNKDGVSEEVCMVDFQTPRFASPVNDLATVLLYGTREDVREHELHSLQRYYYDQLTKNLLAFGLNVEEIFPWEMFQRHIRRNSRLGVYLSIIGLPVLMADRSEISVDIHSPEGNKTLFAETAKITNPQTIKRLTHRLNKIVTQAVELGYI